MVYIDPSIACIVAREFLEAILFINSYFGAIRVNDVLDSKAKISYYYHMTISLVIGLLFALTISLSVGYGLKAAFESGHGFDAEVGMEAGEAVSKLVGFIFVVKLMFKIPKWFGISKFNR